MTHIVHLNVDPEHNQYETLLLKVATKTLTLAQAPSGELSIALVDEQHIHDLNREFRNQDDPTDVLAFQGENIDPETGLAYLGDVIIAVSFARAQARSAGHSTEAELSLLVIHGILHPPTHIRNESSPYQIIDWRDATLMNWMEASRPRICHLPPKAAFDSSMM